MKRLTTILFLLISSISWGQKYGVEKATIMFFSKTPVEDIDAKNTNVNSLFNASTGDIVFSVQMKDFDFKKSLMKEHFNEKYVESEKFPKATFQGKIVDYAIEKSGEQKVKATGKLTIHGVTKDIEALGTIEFVKDRAVVKSKFVVALKDFDIKIPQILWRNIAESIEVNVEITYKSL